MKAPYSTKAMFDLTRNVSKSGKSFGNLFEAMYNQSNGGSTLFWGNVWLEPKSRELCDKGKIANSLLSTSLYLFCIFVFIITVLCLFCCFRLILEGNRRKKGSKIGKFDKNLCSKQKSGKPIDRYRSIIFGRGLRPWCWPLATVH